MSKRGVIHILEDNPSLSDVYQETLAPEYELHSHDTFAEFMAAVQRIPAPQGALAIMDLHLPEGFLWDLMGDAVLPLPFIVVSGESDPATLRDSFRRGAVDYLLKPLRVAELIVKIENIFNSKAQCPSCQSLSQVQLDEMSMTLTCYGHPRLQLTPKETRIISILLGAPDYTITKNALAELLWGTEHASVHPKTLEIHIGNLRRKIRPLGLVITLLEMKSYRMAFTLTPPDK